MSDRGPNSTLKAVVEGYRKEVNLARALRQGAPVSRGLLVAVVLGHLGALAVGSVLTGSVRAPNGDLWVGLELGLMFGAKIDGLVLRGEAWRLVTSLFLHGGWLHLVFNGYAIAVLGPIVERLYGSRRFLVMYVLSGLCAGAASVAWTDGPSVGASGAVFGLLGGLLVFGVKFKTLIPARVSRAFGVGLLPWVVLNLVLGLIPGLKMDNAAHLGGLVSGVLVAGLMSTPLRGEARGWRRWGLGLLFLVACLLLCYGLVFGLRQAIVCSGDSAMFYRCHPAELLTGP